MGVLGEMFPRKRMHEDSDAAQGGQQWRLGPIDLDKGVVTVEAAPQPEDPEQEKDRENG
ncbi:hypothetical protein [Pseudonocardia alni]|uniref:hypothetical protein n=1 Tax=Pseudonocardia alni TaxID=33907 RepID=UPI00332D6E3E